MDNLRTPPTEIEIAEVIDAFNLCGTAPAAKRTAGVIRRLTYERDRFKSAATSAMSLLRQGRIVAAENDLRKALDNDYRD